MTKSIKVSVTELLGQKYFHIFEVKAVKHDGEVIIYDRFLSKKEADETLNFIYDKMTKLYKQAYIRRQTVWC